MCRSWKQTTNELRESRGFQIYDHENSRSHLEPDFNLACSWSGFEGGIFPMIKKKPIKETQTIELTEQEANLVWSAIHYYRNEMWKQRIVQHAVALDSLYKKFRGLCALPFRPTISFGSTTISEEEILHRRRKNNKESTK